MRILLLAIPMALLAQPAWAHHKPNHPDFFGERPAATRAAPHPCGGVSYSPHLNQSRLSASQASWSPQAHISVSRRRNRSP